MKNEYLKQVDDFVYLGSMFTRGGKTGRDIERRVLAGISIKGGLDPVSTSNEAEWLITRIYRRIANK